MARTICLAKLSYDPDLLGWHPSCHQQIVDAGGEWSMHAYWSDNPTTLADEKTAIDYDCVIAVGGVEDISKIDNCMSLDLQIEKHSELLNRLKNVETDKLDSTLIANMQVSGFATDVKTKETLYDTLKAIVE